MSLIVPTLKRKRGLHDTGKYRGITLLSQVLKLLERVLDARRRVEGDLILGTTVRVQERERNSRRGVGPTSRESETGGREETGGTGQYGYGVRRP